MSHHDTSVSAHDRCCCSVTDGSTAFSGTTGHVQLLVARYAQASAQLCLFLIMYTNSGQDCVARACLEDSNATQRWLQVRKHVFALTLWHQCEQALHE